MKGEEQLIEAPCSSPSAVATDAGSASSPSTPSDAERDAAGARASERADAGGSSGGGSSGAPKSRPRGRCPLPPPPRGGDGHMEGEETAGGAAESRGEPVAASRSKHCVAVPMPG